MPDTKPPFRFWSFFFSPQGRVTRLAIWTFVLPVRLTMLAIALIMQTIGFPSDRVDTLFSTPWFMLNTINLVIGLTTMWSIFAVLTKRFHDIGWTGLPALTVFTPLASGVFAYFQAKAMLETASPNLLPNLILTILTNLPTVLAIVLACVPGQRTTNRFGPPLTGSSDEPAQHF